MEDIIDANHKHTKRVWKDFKTKNLEKFYNLFIQSDTLLLADVFESFRNKWIEIYELDSAHFLSGPGLAWEACLKKAEVELELFTDTDMQSMVEKGIRGRICHAIHRYTIENQKYMKNCNKDMESFYPMYWDESNLYGWAMSQKWLMVLNGIKSNFKFNEKFIKTFDEDSDIGYILKVDVEYPKNLHNIDNDLPFLRAKMKNKKCHKLTCNLCNKKTMSRT